MNLKYLFVVVEIFQTLKKYLGSKYVEPALNHEMMRAVLTEVRPVILTSNVVLHPLQREITVVGSGIQKM